MQRRLTLLHRYRGKIFLNFGKKINGTVLIDVAKAASKKQATLNRFSDCGKGCQLPFHLYQRMVP